MSDTDNEFEFHLKDIRTNHRRSTFVESLKFEAESVEIVFDVKQFLLDFAYQTVAIFCGPLLALPVTAIRETTNGAYNRGFFPSLTSIFVSSLLLWLFLMARVALLASGWLSPSFTWAQLLFAVDVLLVLMRALVISVKYAYLGHPTLKRFRTQRLPASEIRQVLLFHWASPNERLVRDQLEETWKRLRLPPDQSLKLYASFSFDLAASEEPIDIIPMKDFCHEILTTTYARSKWVIPSAVILSFLSTSFLVTCSLLYQNCYSAYDILFLGLFSQSHFLALSTVYTFCFVAVKDLLCRLQCMNHLGNCLLTNDLQGPVLGIRCPQQLSNWLLVRVFFKNFGLRYFARLHVCLTLFTATLLIGDVIALVCILLSIKIELIILVFLLMLTVVLSAIVSFLILLGARVNMAGLIHNGLLTRRQQLIVNRVNERLESPENEVKLQQVVRMVHAARIFIEADDLLSCIRVMGVRSTVAVLTGVIPFFATGFLSYVTALSSAVKAQPIVFHPF